jgi:DNA mismatch repair protein MutL
LNPTIGKYDLNTGSPKMADKSQIKILDKNTINKIAAGEVIERPASVVKELVENSIDAQSTKIVIEIEDAGKKLIRVTDNGFGMATEDMKLAFEKHSTSKIDTIDDVYNLKSFGFRGEALASIAAVARVECITSDGASETGRKLIMDGGVIRSFEEVGCPKGTTIKIKDLFQNLPARLKYLKSSQTELSHIIEVVTHFGIYYHKIGIKLVHDGNELLNLPGTSNQLNNLVNIYGKELVRNLIPIYYGGDAGDVIGSNNFEGTGSRMDELKFPKYEKRVGKKVQELSMTLTGYIGKPSITRSDSSYQSIFVNGRYVESRVVSNAIKEAYRTLVMKNRFPVVILFITINPHAVDVNIHPTKLQVRFENEEGVYNRILKAISETLRSHDLIQEAKFAQKPHTVSLKAITTLGVGKPGYPTPILAKAKEGDSNILSEIQRLHSQGEDRPGILPSHTVVQSHLQTESQRKLEQPYQGMNIHPLGQILDTYIIARTFDGMLIIDQHAAHERIMYEKIKTRYKAFT